jgi:hypothetical protein
MPTDDDSAPLARAGAPRRWRRGSFEELEALLELVEALCPRWPVREMRAGGSFLL